MRRALVAVLLALTGCVPAEPSNDEIIRFLPTTVMGRIQRDGEISIGIPEDLFPLAFRFKGRSSPVGFLVDYGNDIADALRVEPRFVMGSGSALLGKVARGEVQVAFPIEPITEERLRAHPEQRTYTRPYWVAHQRLFAGTESGVDEVADLAGKRVCSHIDPDSGVDLTALEPSIELIQLADLGECGPRLVKGTVAAITADDIVLITELIDLARGDDHMMVGDDLTTSGYSAVVQSGGGMGAFVDSVLSEAIVEGRWTQWYERWIRQISKEEPVLPDLSLEEAAALYPTD